MSRTTITRVGNSLFVRSPYSRPFLIEAKRLGGRWHAASKSWEFSWNTRTAVETLCREIYNEDPTLDYGSAYHLTQPAQPVAQPAPGSLGMFGCTQAELRQMFEDHARRGAAGMTPTMLVASMLSDAQEAIAAGDVETGRQYINRAKFGVFEYLAGKAPAPTQPAIALTGAKAGQVIPATGPEVGSPEVRAYRDAHIKDTMRAAAPANGSVAAFVQNEIANGAAPAIATSQTVRELIDAEQDVSPSDEDLSL